MNVFPFYLLIIRPVACQLLGTIVQLGRLFHVQLLLGQKSEGRQSSTATDVCPGEDVDFGFPEKVLLMLLLL